MSKPAEQLEKLLDNAQRILITSHVSPDPDAVSSVLLLGTALEKNLPNKQIKMVLEEKPARDISFLQDYAKLQFQPLLVATEELKPDLFIIVDAMSFERVSRTAGAELRKLVLEKLTAKLVIIDHHEQLGVDKADVYINNRRPATAQEIYELIEKLKLKMPTGYAQTTLLGIISDTARHKFDNPVHRQTYRVVSDLLDAGASIEELENKTDRYSKPQLEVLAELIKNVADSGKGYTYSYLSDDFTRQWLAATKSKDAFKLGVEEFTNNYLRKFADNHWGFVVYPDIAAGDKTYGVSLRAASGVKDVAALAAKLGGGGHKAAAGAHSLKASSVEAVIKKVQAAIEAGA